MPVSSWNFSRVEVSFALTGSTYPIQFEKTIVFSSALRSVLLQLPASTLAPSVPQAASEGGPRRARPRRARHHAGSCAVENPG